MQNLLLGTRNPGKLREYHELLEDMDSRMGIQLIDPDGAGLSIDVVESGLTYFENASRKALGYSNASGLLTLADDSGLEVDALSGQPGIYSARFAPQVRATDADRRNYLLSKLKGMSQPWSARFRCVVVVAQGEEILFSSEAECEGEIIPVERGTLGFGYDPIFLVYGEGRTMAELLPGVKNKVSHRAKAFAPARDFLLDYFNSMSL